MIKDSSAGDKTRLTDAAPAEQRILLLRPGFQGRSALEHLLLLVHAFSRSDRVTCRALAAHLAANI